MIKPIVLCHTTVTVILNFQLKNICIPDYFYKMFIVFVCFFFFLHVQISSSNDPCLRFLTLSVKY